MTRCIHCTRCIRFATEVAGVEELGATGRGEDMEITHLCRAGADLRALRQHHRSLPGRRADLQALRLQRAALGAAARPNRSTCWTRSAATSASTRAAREVMRVLPRLNEDVNEEWISDKTRFAYRRPDAPAARPALCAHATASCGRRPGTRPSPPSPPSSTDVDGEQDRARSPATWCDAEAMVRAEGPDGGARLAQPRLPPGRRQARSARRARLSLQHHHRRHRAGGCDAC